MSTGALGNVGNAVGTAVARHWTIRLRLTLIYGGLFFVAGGLLLAVTYFLVDQRVNHDPTAYGQLQRRLLAAGTLHQDVQVRLADGRTISTRDLIQDFQAQRREYRAEMMESLLLMGSVALAGVGGCTVCLGWLFAGRALRPVHKITETARRIATTGRGLHERIALRGPADEVRQLADTFDLMLERLDQSFDGQRRFVASASHELRTPLAVNRALIEVAVTRPGASADARELGSALLASNERHEHLIEGMLTLAESENTLTERHRVDLAGIVQAVLDEAAGTAREAGVTIEEPQLRHAAVEGDPYLLERLAQNLVDNAIRHNLPAGGRLTARTWSAEGGATLEITNTGPVIHPYETEMLFQPFRRLGNRRAATRGFGLGLAIVRAIATAHHGHATATPLQEGGLTLTVTLPAP